MQYVKYYFLFLIFFESFFMALAGKNAGMSKRQIAQGLTRHLIMYSPVVYALFKGV